MLFADFNARKAKIRCSKSINLYCMFTGIMAPDVYQLLANYTGPQVAKDS